MPSLFCEGSQRLAADFAARQYLQPPTRPRDEAIFFTSVCRYPNDLLTLIGNHVTTRFAQAGRVRSLCAGH
jgi:hypothetical protein